jgi:hypothetical protein
MVDEITIQELPVNNDCEIMYAIIADRLKDFYFAHRRNYPTQNTVNEELKRVSDNIINYKSELLDLCHGVSQGNYPNLAESLIRRGYL